MENEWKLVSFNFDTEIEKALRQQHLAAQLVALVGRYLVPKEPDLSNISMQYSAEKEMLLGKPLENGIYLGLQLHRLQIHFFDNSRKPFKIIQLHGKTFEQGFEELRKVLANVGVKVSALKNEQPYSLSTEAMVNNKFSNSNESALMAATKLRHNAEIIADLATGLNNAEPVRIWPHHFDTGTFFATAQNHSGGATQTIGLGWAMPDEMVTEPYFYLSFWSEKEIKNSNLPAPLEIGSWMMPAWNGAILKLSEIVGFNSAKNQYLRVKQFYNNGIGSLSGYIKNS